ncbi:D-amino acid dehydrogenase [Chitinimonas sp. BJB300]|uniref:D-amino acid dehydrogenase n=1 Tax=Chitinimonas sp. BJB300 TaxID=1559339 RepID=UPI000C0DE6BD|nr:D-amino acid dehydrogenase [Chitinimonas sp. BJB300]PHV11173.1 amino acid dehydrogenase [Chitinimonas sp. BJB300]TSJ87425.1 D-amino acid dehydrogenase [Chitinimonas sp. BJB300]
MRVLILGAGITGVSSAWFLREAGFEVTVLDRQPEAALETSFANGGQISVSQSEPWANPDAPLQVLKWLWHEDSPLLFRPRFDLRQWNWGARFLRECLPSHHVHNTIQMVNLGLYSRTTLQRLRASAGIQYDHSTRGILQIFFDQHTFDAAAEASALMRQYHCHREAIPRERAVELEPALGALGSRLVGATWAEDDESGDAYLFTQGLAKLAADKGVEFRFNTCIRELLSDGGKITGVRVRTCEGRDEVLKADTYLLCMGSYSPLMAAKVGLNLPIYPTKGYSATMSVEGYEGVPNISITDSAMKMVFTRLGDRMRIAGTAELDGYNTELNPVRCQALIRRYFEIFPNSGDPNSVKFWAGLRPSTPSNVPLIGRSRLPNLYLNTGHGTLGWTEGPGSGRAVAELIAGHKPELDFDFLV